MACRQAVGRARRGTVSFLSCIARHSVGISSPVVHESALAEALNSYPASTRLRQSKCFWLQSLRHASSFSNDGSLGSKDTRETPGLLSMRSEDQSKVSDVQTWADGENAFANSAGEGIVDRRVVDADAGEFSTGGVWSFLRAPADGVVVLVDGLHNLTGASWWLTVIGSTLAFRMALFPFTITYIKKSAQFAASMSLLPPIRPPKDSGRSFAEQYSAFTKRRLELGVPSPLWVTAGLLQAPLFLYWIIALRGMAMNNHPGFESGGVLWFVDLTVPVHGALGALFPTLVALTYFTNIQVSFRVIKPRNDLTGFFMKIYQWWLEAVTIPLFIMGFYLPQGVFMYWLTNNCFTLAQSVALQNDSYRARFGLPLLSELEKFKAKNASRSADDIADSEFLDVDTLLSSATKHITEDRDEEALKIMRFLQSRYPEEPEVYNLHGMFYIKKQRWPEATEYYSRAISKAKDDTSRITALMGVGISLYNQGRRGEAIDFMKPLLNIRVPKDPLSRQKYLRALVTLASVMSQEGLKDEALSVLKLGLKWDRSINAYIKELQQDVTES